MSIETRWKMNTLKVTYADGFITQRLLSNLNIEDTCFLHGDYFHLMKEVWPKEEISGSVHFRTIKEFLQCMLMSKTIREWDDSYESARF